jgi:hypothetical protein
VSIVGLGLLYVPLTLFVVNLFEHQGSFGVILQRDYGALLACTLMAWAAAHLPVALAGLALDRLRPSPIDDLALWLLAKFTFGALMVCALRTIFGVSYGTAISTVSLSWVSVFFESSLGWLASPFIIYFGYSYFRTDIGDILSSFRTRQGFRRYLEA